MFPHILLLPLFPPPPPTLNHDDDDFTDANDHDDDDDCDDTDNDNELVMTMSRYYLKYSHPAPPTSHIPPTYLPIDGEQ